MFRWKVSCTCSASPCRSRPLFTKMQVNCDPTARCSNAAATEESTPPLRPQITRSLPTCSRTRATVSATKLPAVHDPEQPQISRTKLRRMVMPSGVCCTSGWNCRPNHLCPSDTAAQSLFSVRASVAIPSGNRSTRSPWLIHTGAVAPSPARSRLEDVDNRRSAWPYSRAFPGVTVPPSWCIMACIP